MIAWWRLKPFTISHGLGEDEKPVGENSDLKKLKSAWAVSHVILIWWNSQVFSLPLLV